MAPRVSYCSLILENSGLFGSQPVFSGFELNNMARSTARRPKLPRESGFRRLIRRARSWLKHPTVRKLAAAGSVVTIIAGLVGTAGNLERIPALVCRVPGIHALCGWIEIGGVAGKVEERAWQDAQKAKDSRALRAYLVAYPSGVYADEVTTRIAACRSTQREVWTAEKRSLPLYVATSTGTGASIAAAREMALQRGQKDAANLCAGFTGEFRLRGATAAVNEWLCREHSNGTACGFEGTAQCDVEARRLISEETCR
jgi:hypothetical protein